jgi:hypothetical protein
MKYLFDTTESGEKLYTENDLKNSFLAGYEAGKPKWHEPIKVKEE